MTWADQYRLNEALEQTIRTAALEQCREVGYAALTIETIANRARCGRQTIYRRWSSKGILLLDAYLKAAGGPAEFPDTGDITADIQARMDQLVHDMYTPEFGPILLALLGGARHDPRLDDRLVTYIVIPEQAACFRRLQAAVDTGQLAPDADPHLLVDQLYGPLYYRFLVTGELTSREFVRKHVRTLIGGAASRPTQGQPA